ncbi:MULTISPECIES: chorismate mutase [Halobacteriovorax]|nr:MULTISPECIES: chorismate mutase [Halobacteriovorax]
MKIAPLNSWMDIKERPLVIAGPCSAESEEQVYQIAKELVANGKVDAFRAGIWKPRTRPNTFEGVGLVGLPWMERVKKDFGIPITTEVANASHVELALKHNVDILWIGARTTVSPFAVQEIADALRGVDIPVMVKNPINLDLALWMGAIERFSAVGLDKLAAIHRGFSSAEKTKYRNKPYWAIPIELKRLMPELPIICDPSHIAGNRNLIGEVCQKAMDMNMDGVMVETHITPEKALSDAAQQVTPKMLHDIITHLQVRDAIGLNDGFEDELNKLRNKIDQVDNDILEMMHMRMNIVKQIGKLKSENNVTPLQVGRMDALMKDRLEKGKKFSLDPRFVEELYHAIHTESVREQTRMMNDFKKES